MHLRLHYSQLYQTIKTAQHVTHRMTWFSLIIRLCYFCVGRIHEMLKEETFSHIIQNTVLDVNVMIPLRESMSNVFHLHNSRLFE